MASTSTQSSSGLLRLITCGSVDDGKSTLIGRLLHDSKAIHDDQLEAVRKTTAARGGGVGGGAGGAGQEVDLALLTDGLRAEREQGITIDVAYRYFATPVRKFILADTPGHVQYTRNMVTGASTADVAVILIDARQGVVEQTRRHACIAVLLGVSHLIVCVNKMDLVEYSQSRFDEIRADFQRFAGTARPDGNTPIAKRAEVSFFPISALKGDNVVERTDAMAWYTGPALLAFLEAVPDRASMHVEPTGVGARLPVQYVIRPQSQDHHDYRGYAGQMAAGVLRIGDEVEVRPSGYRSRITRIHIGPEQVNECFVPQSVAVELADDIDISRGEMIVRADDVQPPREAREIEVTVVWMAPQPLVPGKRVTVQFAAKAVAAVVKEITQRLDIQTLEQHDQVTQLGLNEIGRAVIKLASPVAVDSYAQCRGTGCCIIIDDQTNNTVGAGMMH
jgi:sulfate adenylyltransferase large subunit